MKGNGESPQNSDRDEFIARMEKSGLSRELAERFLKVEDALRSGQTETVAVPSISKGASWDTSEAAKDKNEFIARMEKSGLSRELAERFLKAEDALRSGEFTL